MSETQLVSSILDALTWNKDILAWRCNSGAARMKGFHVRFGAKGMADILAIVQPGRFLAIEVKTEKGKLGPDQILWRDKVLAVGGEYFCCRSVGEALRAVEYVKNRGNHGESSDAGNGARNGRHEENLIPIRPIAKSGRQGARGLVHR